MILRTIGSGATLLVLLALMGCRSTQSTTDSKKDKPSKDPVCRSLNEGIELYQADNIRDAIAIWKEVVYDGKKSSSCYGRCFFNIGMSYSKLEERSQAITWFKKILASDLNNLEEGDNLMEPYTNYHHRASLNLAFLYQEENDLTQALAYLDSAQAPYGYEPLSGTSFEKRAVSMAYIRSDFHLEAQDTIQAAHILAEKILDYDWMARKATYASYTNLDFYRDLRPALAELLDAQNIDRKTWTDGLQKAIQTLSVSESSIGEGEEQRPIKIATFTWQDYTYRIGSADEEYDRAKFIERILENSLFEYLLEVEDTETEED